MRIERFDPVADTGKVRACYDFYAAGTPVDDPNGPTMTEPVFSGWFAMGWTSCPRETCLATADDGTPAAGYVLELPVKANKTRAELVIFVDPARRRAGLGTTLLRHAQARAAELGRTVLAGDAREGSPGSAFAVAAGARLSIMEVRRVLDLAGIPAGHLAGLRGQAEEAARGYSLISWQEACPEEYLDQVAQVSNAMADAPHSPGYEEEREDAERLRERERRAGAQGLRVYSVAARHDGTGELAGLTELAVDSLQPDWGHQELTAVTRGHRGHRLGLLVKVAMLELLSGAEPGLERIITGNADANRYMIAINEQLGFRVLDRWPSWQLEVTASASRQAIADSRLA
jgi:GNAT superfamily N-acetyltransferase